MGLAHVGITASNIRPVAPVHNRILGGILPLISFIIPCYKQSAYLADAVRSVLSQTVVDIEAIVIDDGSPDDPLTELSNFQSDPRLHYIRQQNRGLPAARNRGIQDSHGTYLNFLDSDDWLDPEFGERLSAVLESDPNLGFAYCDLEEVYEPPASSTGQTPYSVGASRRTTSGDILPSLLLGGYFTPNCALVPRSVMETVGTFDEGLGGHADWDLWLRIIARGWRARYVDRRLTHYRIHGDNMSFQREQMRATQLAVLGKLFRTCPERAAEAVQELIRTVDETHWVNLRLRDAYTELDASCRDIRTRYEVDLLKNDALFREQQSWIATLEEAKNWHEQQASYWKAETDRLLSHFREQASWIEQLTAQKEALEKQLRALASSPAESHDKPSRRSHQH